MEGRRRQKWDNNYNNNSYNNRRSSQNKRPPRGGSCNWQPTVPKWEKDFCKVIGSLDWETLLHMKKFMHLYENVIKWDDSAGEEAFLNAKKRFWAEINGFSCHLSLPDPDLYIDKIDWDSKIDPEPDFELEHVTSNADQNHDPVVIFGDSLFPNQSYTLAGWGDEEENFKVPENYSSGNTGAQWEQNWNNSPDNWPVSGWQDYSNNMTWGDGWNTDCDWNYANNNTNYQVGTTGFAHEIADGESGTLNAGGYVSAENYTSRNDGVRNETYWGPQPDKRRHDSREWNSFSNSCGRVGHRAAITVGQTWNH